MDRVHDKEATVRQQAIVAITKLLKADEAHKSSSRLLNICIESLARDPSA